MDKTINIYSNSTIVLIRFKYLLTGNVELNVLKGAEENIKKIKYIIMEEPKSVINTRYLPVNMYSKYIGAPSGDVIKKFMEKNNFIEIMRVQENAIEDNVMYENIY